MEKTAPENRRPAAPGAGLGALLAAALLAALPGCPNPPGQDPSADIAYTAAANGSAGAASSTALIFSFSADIAGLDAADISAGKSGDSGSAAKGALTGSGRSWALAITVAAAGSLTVSINRAGIEGGEKQVTVHKEDPALEGAVRIAGTAKAGETLAADTANLGGGGTIGYQWQRGDSADGSFADIPGARDGNYTLAAADQGKYVRVTVSRAGHSGAISSAPSGPVAASELPLLTGAVSLSGTAKAGETLAADASALGGSGEIAYRWERSDSAAGGFADIAGAAGSAYTLAAADLGKYIRVTVRREGRSGAVSSAPVNVPPPQLPPQELSISIGFNYGDITIAGSDGANVIYKASSDPKSIKLSVSGYSDVQWRVDGNPGPAGTGASIVLNASDYSVKAHSLAFAGKKDGKLYSQSIPFTVKR
jgi:hypothetical protein